MKKIKTQLFLFIGLVTLFAEVYQNSPLCFLAPLSALDDGDLTIEIKPITGLKIIKNSIIRPITKVHTSQYADFTDNAVSTNGAANCTALVFINKTTQKWSIWHYPLPFAQSEMKKYLLGSLVNPYIAKTLPLAFGSMLENIEPQDQSALYIFGGGTNKIEKQNDTNKILAEIFTDLGISEIYDMTPHKQHGSDIILSHLTIGKSNTLKNESKAPITIDYFYGSGDFTVKQDSLINSPRLIGGTKIKDSIKNNSSLFLQAA